MSYFRIPIYIVCVSALKYPWSEIKRNNIVGRAAATLLETARAHTHTPAYKHEKGQGFSKFMMTAGPEKSCPCRNRRVGFFDYNRPQTEKEKKIRRIKYIQMYTGIHYVYKGTEAIWE